MVLGARTGTCRLFPKAKRTTVCAELNFGLHEALAPEYFRNRGWPLVLHGTYICSAGAGSRARLSSSLSMIMMLGLRHVLDITDVKRASVYSTYPMSGYVFAQMKAGLLFGK